MMPSLSYPLILLPEPLKTVNPPLISKPLDLVYPTIPPKPNPLPPPPQPINVLRLIKHSLIVTLITFFLGGVINIFNPAFAGGLGIFFLLAGLSFIFLRTLAEKQSFPRRQRNYEQLQQEHLVKLSDYSQNLAQFEQIKQTHTENSQSHQSQLREWEANIKEFRGLLGQILKNTQPYSEITHNKSKSYAEQRFYYILQKHFSDQIRNGIQLQNISNSDKTYDLDFAYCDEEIKLYIDIEIDEPYQSKTYEPSHYLEEETEEKRHHYLLENLWIIIRFTEEQIVRYPQSCCKTIAEVIYQVTGDETILSQLKNESSLSITNRWNYEEAVKMAEEKYRQTYLK